MNKLFVFILVASPFVAEALTPSQVFEKAKDSVVVVYALNGKGEPIAQGSGVILSANRVATNCHVVKDGVSFQVRYEKHFTPAIVFAGDADKDICILQVENLIGKPAELGKAVELKVGVSVYAIGAPKGLELSLSDGIVSSLRGSSPPLIQTTAAISKGSSGGGLFDSNGMLVGFTTLFVEDGQSLNFASPVEWLVDIKPSKKIDSTQRSQIDWYARSAALLERQEWIKLIDWGMQWAKEEPENSDTWYYIGYAQQELKQFNEALVSFRQSLSINPKDADAWNGIGSTYDDLKSSDKAISAYREGIRLEPDNAGIWYNLGITYTKIKQENRAIEAFNEAIRINPKYEDAFIYLGNTFIDLKRYDDAINVFVLALQINQQNNLTWNGLGIAYKNQVRYPEAIHAYRQAVLYDSEDSTAWYNLAVAYYLYGDNTSALLAVKNLRELDPIEAEKLFNLIVPR